MNPHPSSACDDLPTEMGDLEGATEAAIKRVPARELEALMASEGLSKAALARQTGTGRWSLYCLLDPTHDAVTLATLRKAARAVGRRVELRLVTI